MESSYRNNSKKGTSGAAIFFNENKEILLLKPTYKDYLTLPGGGGEIDESPKMTCVREVKEEIGLDIQNPKLICIDYYHYPEYNNECLHFIFNGGVLTTEHIENIKLPPDEIEKYVFLSIDEAVLKLNERFQKRITHCLEAIKKDTVIYLENGNL